MCTSMSMPKGYLASETSVHFMNYHFVWCPKYRRELIVGTVEARLKELIQAKADEMGWTVIALETKPHHVHLFVQATPKDAPNHIVAAFKGYTSRLLRREFPELRSRLPSLWTRSYFVSTHGHVSSETIKRYVEEQKGV